MDMNGNRIGRNRVSRLFAVLWILAAALAMQFVASAQVFSSRFSVQQSAGNVSLPENRTSDTALTRHVIRAFPAADLRFTADRADGKAAPGGPGPFVLPDPVSTGFAPFGHLLRFASSQASIAALPVDRIRVRGPPEFRV